MYQIRPAFGGNIVATIVNPEHRPQMATVREGVMKKAILSADYKGEVIRHDVKKYVADTDYVVKVIERHVEKAKNNRISTIVATPHVVSGKHTLKDLEIIKDRIHDLKELARVYNIEVLEGCELFLNHDYLEALEQNIFIPIENTHYLLVEFDVRKELGNENEVEDRLYEIQYKGYTPVIAHVERYFKGSLDIERIQDFIDNGYLIQVNATSFLGYHGKHAQKFAYQLLNQGLLHVIATDTHRCDGHRSPCLQEVFDLLVKKYSYEDIHTLMYENPLHIINNEEVDPIEGKTSFFKKIFKRR